MQLLYDLFFQFGFIFGPFCQGFMRLKVEHILMPGGQIGLMDDAHRHPDCGFFEQHFNVFRIHLHTAVTDLHADTVGFVGAVD